MNSQELSMLYYSLTNIPPLADTEDSYFSDKHMMNNRELCGQVQGYVTEIHKAFNPNISATLKVSSLNKNGAQFTLRSITSNKGSKGNV